MGAEPISLPLMTSTAFTPFAGLIVSFALPSMPVVAIAPSIALSPSPTSCTLTPGIGLCVLPGPPVTSTSNVPAG